MILNFILPWPPFSGNHRNGYGKGRFYNTKEYKAYQDECYYKTRGLVSKPIDYEVEVTMHFAPPDNRRRDRSNYIKTIEDVITRCGIWKDDSLAKAGHSYMCPKSDSPCIYIEISELKTIHAPVKLQLDSKNSS